MLSQDKLLNIEVIKNPFNIDRIISKSDISIINIDVNIDMNEFSKKIFESNDKHLLFIFNRLRDKKKSFPKQIKELSNIYKKWLLFDIIYLKYDKGLAGCGISKNTEDSYIFYKKEFPLNLHACKWFSENEHSNINNLWDLGIQHKDIFGTSSKIEEFNDELIYMLLCLCKPLNFGKINYYLNGCDDLSDNVMKFIKKSKIVFEFYADSNSKALELLDKYNNI